MPDHPASNPPPHMTFLPPTEPIPVQALTSTRAAAEHRLLRKLRRR